MRRDFDRDSAEARFRSVFSHLDVVTAYARRRGSSDPTAIAAEVMTVAWRRLAKVPQDDPRPWLYATARNLVWAEARRARRAQGAIPEPERSVEGPEPLELDPDLSRALQSLSLLDREALLLIAWEELTPTQAAKALGIHPAAFRVRLLRARRRLRASLDASPAEAVAPAHLALLDMERT
jgi:RNA polymerase sigma-70 factor (ECF subfamily)